MRLLSYVLLGAVLPLLPGCNPFSKDDDPPPMPVATATQPPAVTAVVTNEPPKPGEIVRPELEDRADGITGKLVTITGAKARLQVPNEWTVAPADKMQIANASDNRSRLAMAPIGADGQDAALGQTSNGSQLTSCTWRPTQTLSTGKDKLLAQVADGLCQRNGVQTNAAYMATEGLFVLGSWDEGSSYSEVFGSMRSVAKIPTGTATPNLVACCQRLAANAASQPPPQNAFMLQAAALCESQARSGNTSGVNSQLAKFGMSCK